MVCHGAFITTANDLMECTEGRAMILEKDHEVTLTKHLLRELFEGAGNEDAEARKKAEMLSERIYNVAIRDRLSEQSTLQGLGYINKGVRYEDKVFLDVAIRAGVKGDTGATRHESYRVILLKEAYIKFFGNLMHINPFPLESVLVRLDITNPRCGVHVDDNGKAWPRRSGVLSQWGIV